MSAIVLLSGGLDSAVNLKQAVLECGVAAACRNIESRVGRD